LYAVVVVPGALPLHVIVVTMLSTPLASSESLCVVFIVTIGTSPPPVSKTLVVLSVRPTVGPGASDAQAQSEGRTQREARMPSQKARSDAEVLPECHERIAPNGTSGKAETAAPGRHESPSAGQLCGFTARASALSVRSWDSRFPGSATPSVAILGDGIESSRRYTRLRRSVYRSVPRGERVALSFWVLIQPLRKVCDDLLEDKFQDTFMQTPRLRDAYFRLIRSSVLIVPNTHSEDDRLHDVSIPAKEDPAFPADTLFEFDSDKLTPEGEQLLQKWIDRLNRRTAPRVIVEAHTDSIGRDATTSSCQVGGHSR
jgi:flagellar motor protein MotB